MLENSTHYILLAGLGIIVVGLFVKRFKPTAVFAAVTLLMLVLQIIPINEFLGHMANGSVITIFLLIFITAGLKENFNLLGILHGLFKGIKRPQLFLLAFSSLVSTLSSFVNNTPIVALFIPYIYKWTEARNISPSKFLIPLSFAATLGGTITLIGTSTNLVLNGLMTSNGYAPFGFFDFLVPGVLITVFGILFLATFGYFLLPEHKDLLKNFEKDQRKYILEMRVSSASKLINKTVAEAELRNLDGVYLVEIGRGKNMISPVSPQEVLRENDLLYFAGDTNNVTELLHNNELGLVLPKTEKFNLGNQLNLVEALVPAMSDLGDVRVKETNFRERFDAAIVAIQRHGERLGGKIGDQKLQYGDLLLLTAGAQYSQKTRASKNLYSLSVTAFNNKEKNPKKRIFGVLLAVIIAAMIIKVIGILVGLLLIQASLLVLKLTDFSKIKRQFNPDLYIILVCAIAMGTALINTGTADWMVEGVLVVTANWPPMALVSGLFLFTIFLTSFVTNIAAVSIMFPVIAAMLPQLNMAAHDAFLLLAFGASCSFLTPVSYQTNLMVYEPGGYRPIDFLRVGLPLTILYALICIAYFNLS